MRYYRSVAAACVCACLAACATTPQQTATDLGAALDVAAAAGAVYAAQPGADAAKVSQARALVSAAQAAVLTWTSSASPGDGTVANAAVAALVAYQASLASLQPAGH